MSFLTDITPAVDNIVRELRESNLNSGISIAARKALIYRSIQYLPSLRNESNIPLLTLEILKSPSLALPDLVSTDTLIDGFRSAIARKYSITDPTIPPEEWTGYLINPVIESLSNERILWRALPLLSALIQASKYETLKDEERKKRRSGSDQSLSIYIPKSQQFLFQQDLFIKIFNQIITLPLNNSEDYNNYLDIIHTALVSLAKCQWALDDEVYSRISHSQTIIRGLKLIYLHRDTSVLRELERAETTPYPSTIAYNLLGGFSQIIRKSVESNYRNTLTFNDLDLALNQIYTFTEDLSRAWLRYKHLHEDASLWPILKQLIFGICLQLQGFAGLMLHVNRPKHLSTTYLSGKILKSLSPVYFILEKLGSTSFEPFNFTYNVCIDVIVMAGRSHIQAANPVVDSLIQSLAGSCNLGAVFDNEMDRGKIIFLIDLFEKLIHFSSSKLINGIILPYIQIFLLPNKDPAKAKVLLPLLESSHSVMLQYLRLSSDIIVIDDSIVMDYLDTLLTLFPYELSTPQFLLALNTIAQSVTSPNRPTKQLTYEFLEKLFIKCKATLPGLPLIARNEENGPPTVRTVFVSGLIHSLPLLEPKDFEFWLERVDGLFIRHGPYFSPLFQAENEYLQEDIEKMISGELDLSLADIGLRWWHRTSSKL